MSAIGGSPLLPDLLGALMFDLIFGIEEDSENCVGTVVSSTGIAVFVEQNDKLEHQMHAGRDCQRFALAVTALGRNHAFSNQAAQSLS